MSADKQALREEAWRRLRDAGAARFPGVEGRIPNFIGAEAAARRLAAEPVWGRARILKCNPDSPQLPVRKQALSEGKIVYMAVPKLADAKPFWRLDPDRLEVPVHQAASIKGATTYGESVALDEMEPIDLVVCGSVAVDRRGRRLGKGGGYSDLEFALAIARGLITSKTTVATTIHPSQLFPDDVIPVTDHDFPLDLIVTPDEVIVTNTSLPRPEGVLDHHLEDEKRATIPVLAGAVDQ